MLEKDIISVYDEGEIILEPVKIEINDLADLKVGEQLPNSKLEETVYHIGKKQVKTLEKSFYHAKNVDEFFLNIYKINETNLIHESSTLMDEEKYNKYLKSAKQIKLK